ncbi:MAG: hypothetical protein LBJ04_04185 [Sphingobacterium sp.]|jgi:hypothetical protein|nr:hypothetical protein [Sphingobacterium sp.]
MSKKEVAVNKSQLILHKTSLIFPERFRANFPILSKILGHSIKTSFSIDTRSYTLFTLPGTERQFLSDHSFHGNVPTGNEILDSFYGLLGYFSEVINTETAQYSFFQSMRPESLFASPSITGIIQENISPEQLGFLNQLRRISCEEGQLEIYVHNINGRIYGTRKNAGTWTGVGWSLRPDLSIFQNAGSAAEEVLLLPIYEYDDCTNLQGYLNGLIKGNNS